MSELRKANTDQAYFITLSVVGWIDIFSRSRYADIIINSFEFCRKNKGFEIFAYVIMPSHIHFIARSLQSNMANILRDIKAFTAKQILFSIENENGESRKEWLLHMFKYYAKYKQQNKKYQFWQKTNYPTEILNHKMLIQKIDYIHNNPVTAGLVTRAETWTYSSANPFSIFKVDVY